MIEKLRVAIPFILRLAFNQKEKFLSHKKKAKSSDLNIKTIPSM